MLDLVNVYLFIYYLYIYISYLICVFQIFKFGTKDGKPAASSLGKHSYILQPVSGNAKYSKDRSDASANKDQALQNAEVKLDDVTLCLSKVGKWRFSTLC